MRTGRVSARAVHETRTTRQQVQREVLNITAFPDTCLTPLSKFTSALSSRKRSLDAEVATLSQRQKRDDDWKSTYDVTGTLTACLEAQNLPEYQAAVTGMSLLSRGLKQARHRELVPVMHSLCCF